MATIDPARNEETRRLIAEMGKALSIVPKWKAEPSTTTTINAGLASSLVTAFPSFSPGYEIIETYDAISGKLLHHIRSIATTPGAGTAPPTTTEEKDVSTKTKEADLDLTDWTLVDEILECEAVHTAYLWGPPGIGKTYSAYTCGGKRLEHGLYAITLTEETPAAELRGHFIPRGGEMLWMHGPVILAMLGGSRLVINEVTHASPDAWSFMLPILEGAVTARLTLPTGETVVPAPGFHVICTDNCPPMDLPPALKDRFDVQVNITEPHPKAIALLPEHIRPHAMTTAALSEDRRISLRGWFSVAKLEEIMGRDRAMAAVFGRKRAAQLQEALKLGART